MQWRYNMVVLSLHCPYHRGLTVFVKEGGGLIYIFRTEAGEGEGAAGLIIRRGS